jgi:hypothetical protein
LLGTRAVHEVLIQDHSNAKISLSFVWINMLKGDSEEAARHSAEIIGDQRVQQFYDPNRLLGKAIAKSIHPQGSVAWDMYLFYSEGIEWTEQPPIPFDWAHQLDDSWADPNHFAWDKALISRFHKIIDRLTKS